MSTRKKKKTKKSARASAKKVAKARSAKTKPRKKVPAKKRRKASPRKTRSRSARQNPVLERRRSRGRAGTQSGDLQGLRDIEDADSESVDELLEEGNAFEADAVAGVEHAGEDQAREVHTHQVPEDDVPDEYLDND